MPLKDRVILAALYLGALNFKEMAATLPAVLVCYELIYRGKFRFQVSGMRRWLGIAILTLIAAAYLLPSFVSRSALRETYNPQFSLQRFLDSWQVYLGYLFYLFLAPRCSCFVRCCW